MKSLQAMKVQLDALGLDNVVEESPVPHLVIFSGFDKQKREMKINLFLQPLEVGGALPSQAHEPGEEYVRMQIDAVFPFTVKNTALSDVAQFLHFLNLQVDFPGFYLNHLNNTVLYRFVQIAGPNQIPINILISILGIVMFFEDVFEQSLEQVANGDVSFVDLLQQIEKILGKVAMGLEKK